MTTGRRARCVAVIAGSGMAGMVDAFEVVERVGFERIVGVGTVTVPGHIGEVCTCRVDESRLIVALGRRHGYERATESMRRMIEWLSRQGVTELVVTSAVGGLRSTLVPGELVLTTDILDLRGAGEHDGYTGGGGGAPGRITSRPLELDAQLSSRLEAAAKSTGVPLQRGTLACLSGPTYETPAEVEYLQRIGADLATMSAVSEVEIANARGIPVASIALVTNPGTGIAASVPGHSDVIEVAARASGSIARIIRQLVIS